MVVMPGISEADPAGEVSDFCKSFYLLTYPYFNNLDCANSERTIRSRHKVSCPHLYLCTHPCGNSTHLLSLNKLVENLKKLAGLQKGIT